MNTPASAIQEFVDSCVAPGTQDRVPKVEVWKWMGAIVAQVRLLVSFPSRFPLTFLFLYITLPSGISWRPHLGRLYVITKASTRTPLYLYAPPIT